MRTAVICSTSLILTASAWAQKPTNNCHDASSCFADCDKGVAASCETVGGMFENGIGVEANREKAIQFYQQACRGGDKRACHKRNVLSAREEPAAKAPAPDAEAKKEDKAKTAAPHVTSPEGCEKRCKKRLASCLSKLQAASADDGDTETGVNDCEDRASECEEKCGGDSKPKDASTASKQAAPATPGVELPDLSGALQ